MAREFIDGFETRSVDMYDPYARAVVVSTAGLDMAGSYCAKCYAGHNNLTITLGAFTEKYIAFRFRFSVSYTYYIVQFYEDTTDLGGLSYDNAGKRLYMFGTYGPSNTIYKDVTYFIQLYYKLGNVDGRGVVKVDGIQHINFTGDTDYGYTPNKLKFSSFSSSSVSYFDNIVIDNSEMPEKTEIVVVRPTASGFHTDFTATPSGNNYTRVDETPYNDLDYVGSNVENDIDTYVCGEDLPSDVAVVNCVQLQARVRKDFGATLDKFNFVLRSNDTDYHDSDRTVTETMSTFRNMYLYGPTGSGVWHKTNVDPLEIGVRARA